MILGLIFLWFQIVCQGITVFFLYLIAKAKWTDTFVWALLFVAFAMGLISTASNFLFSNQLYQAQSLFSHKLIFGGFIYNAVKSLIAFMAITKIYFDIRKKLT